MRAPGVVVVTGSNGSRHERNEGRLVLAVEKGCSCEAREVHNDDARHAELQAFVVGVRSFRALNIHDIALGAIHQTVLYGEVVQQLHGYPTQSSRRSGNP